MSFLPSLFEPFTSFVVEKKGRLTFTAEWSFRRLHDQIKGTLSYRNNEITLSLFPCFIAKYHQIYD